MTMSSAERSSPAFGLTEEPGVSKLASVRFS